MDVLLSFACLIFILFIEIKASLEEKSFKNKIIFCQSPWTIKLYCLKLVAFVLTFLLSKLFNKRLWFCTLVKISVCTKSNWLLSIGLYSSAFILLANLLYFLSFFAFLSFVSWRSCPGFNIDISATFAPWLYLS